MSDDRTDKKTEISVNQSQIRYLASLFNTVEHTMHAARTLEVVKDVQDAIIADRNIACSMIMQRRAETEGNVPKKSIDQQNKKIEPNGNLLTKRPTNSSKRTYNNNSGYNDNNDNSGYNDNNDYNVGEPTVDPGIAVPTTKMMTMILGRTSQGAGGFKKVDVNKKEFAFKYQTPSPGSGTISSRSSSQSSRDTVVKMDVGYFF